MPALREESALAYAKGGHVTLDGILESHRYLFRLQVFPEADYNRRGDLVAPRILGKFGRDLNADQILALKHEAVTLKSLLDYICVWDREVKMSLHDEAEAARRVDKPWLAATSWLSASPSLAYTLFEGQRREQLGWTKFEPEDAEIVVIDTHALPTDDMHMQLAKRAIEERCDEEHPYAPQVYERANKMSYMFQTVLIHGCVPKEAIAARWRWSTVRGILMPLYHTCAGPAQCRHTTFRDFSWHCESSHQHLALEYEEKGTSTEAIIDDFLERFKKVASKGLVKVSQRETTIPALAIFTSTSMWMLRTRWFTTQQQRRGGVDQKTLHMQVTLRAQIVKVEEQRVRVQRAASSVESAAQKKKPTQSTATRRTRSSGPSTATNL